MKKKYKYLLIGCFAIFLIDTLGSIASREFNFNYAIIWPPSIAVYATLGVMLAQKESLTTTVWLTGFLGTFDATIGWKVAMLLNANTGRLNNNPSLSVWAVTVVLVTIYGAIVGLISGWLRKLFPKRKAKFQSSNKVL